MQTNNRFPAQPRAVTQGSRLKPSSNYAQVWVKDHDGSFHHVGKNMNKIKLAHFSEFASYRLEPANETGDPRCTGDNAVLISNWYVDVESARKLCSWIESNDIAKPTPLTLSLVGPDHFFQDVANLHSTAYAFQILKEARGNEIHDALCEYVHYGPLAFDEFAMLVDQCSFDNGLCTTVYHHTMHLKLSLHPPLDMARIEAYAKELGTPWREMMSIAHDIRRRRQATRP